MMTPEEFFRNVSKPITKEQAREYIREVEYRFFIDMKVIWMRDYTWPERLFFWIRGRFEEDAT